MRDFPGYWLHPETGKRFMAFELAPIAIQDDPTFEPRCMCEIYRERLWKALRKLQFRKAYRFAYFGAVRMFQLDERSTPWDADDVEKPQKSGLLLRTRRGLHALLAPKPFRQAGASS